MWFKSSAVVHVWRLNVNWSCEDGFSHEEDRVKRSFIQSTVLRSSHSQMCTHAHTHRLTKIIRFLLRHAWAHRHSSPLRHTHQEHTTQTRVWNEQRSTVRCGSCSSEQHAVFSIQQTSCMRRRTHLWETTTWFPAVPPMADFCCCCSASLKLFSVIRSIESNRPKIYLVLCFLYFPLERWLCFLSGWFPWINQHLLTWILHRLL